MEPIGGSETSAIINQMPGNYPKGNLLYSVHGESLKSWNVLVTGSGVSCWSTILVSCYGFNRLSPCCRGDADKSKWVDRWDNSNRPWKMSLLWRRPGDSTPGGLTHYFDLWSQNHCSFMFISWLCHMGRMVTVAQLCLLAQNVFCL